MPQTAVTVGSADTRLNTGEISYSPILNAVTQKWVRMSNEIRLNVENRAWREKLRVFFAITVVLLTVWTLTAISILNARNTSLETAKTNVSNLSAAFAEETYFTIRNINDIMSEVADQVIAHNGNFNVYKFKNHTEPLSNSFDQIILLGPNGRLRSATIAPHTGQVDYSDREYFRVHLERVIKGIFIGAPVTGRLTHKITIPISMRLETKDGRFLGVLAFSFQPITLTHLNNIVNLGPRGFMGLARSDNVLLARFTSTSPDGTEGIGKIINIPQTPVKFESKHDNVSIRPSFSDHVMRIISDRRVFDYPLWVGVGFDLDDVMAPANTYTKILLVAVGIITLLLAGLVRYLLQAIDRRAAHKIALDEQQLKLKVANNELTTTNSKLATANTNLQASTERAEQAETLLVDAMNCISEAFVIFDKDDRLILCNDLYWQLYPPSTELLKPGVSFEELLRYNLAHGAYTDAIGHEEEWLAEHMRMHRRANLVVEQPWYDGRYLMVTDRRMKSGGTAGLRIDITNLVRTREALEKALDKAEAVSQAKTLFLANMSHELRTPLNAIIGFSQLIRDQTLGPAGVPAYAEYAKDIHDSGEHLLEIINNVLNASRIEVGKFDIKEETIEIGEIVRSAMLAVRVQASKKSLALEQRLPEEPVMLRADALRLRQILINLLANAVKFTPEGGRVTLSFEASPAAAVFTVADTGIGMSLDEIAVATEPFRQIENVLVKRHEGVGLGLSLAKHMTEMHGGTLEIESEKGAGTTVRVVLPAERILHTPKASAVA